MTVSILPVLGADIELGNAWTGSAGRTNLEAASRVLRQLKKLGRLRGVDPGGGSFFGSTEWGRNWLVNGGCIYVDMAHIEVCPPETLAARDHTAAVHAMYRIIRMCR
ncbi:MAG TPA: hypothetical protein VGY53_06535, partial [Isosphaeraceae bacterium]|nr:hypothetical protein [Isosphaeraceae bacterium]